MNEIHVLLVDDQTIVRVGIQRMVAQLPGIRVIDEARDGHEALRMMRRCSPHVVLMDLEMPEMNGLDATRQVTQEFPGSKVIVLSCHTAGDQVLRAIRAGARGYIPKDSKAAELEHAIRSVARDQTYLHPAISKNIQDLVRSAGNTTFFSKPTVPLSELTPRQREVLKFIAEGKTTKEIAFLLNLSPKTVETHRAQLIFRLDIHHVPGLVRYAMREGLIPPEIVAQPIFSASETPAAPWSPTGSAAN